MMWSWFIETMPMLSAQCDTQRNGGILILNGKLGTIDNHDQVLLILTEKVVMVEKMAKLTANNIK